MSKVNLGWLKDKNGEKFAPKTYTNQVLTKTGEKLEDILEKNEEAIENKITTPTTAVTGQILEVEETDKNGKPTKWKAVDKPIGGVSGTFVESVEQTTISTESSGKNIITVTKSDGSTNEVEILNGADGKTPRIDKDGYVVYDSTVYDDNDTSSNSVKYIAQELTSDQKLQARENIGAANKDDVSNISQELSSISKSPYLNTWTDEPPMLDAISGGYRVTFPTTVHVYYNGAKFTISARNFTFTCSSTQYLHHLLVNPSTIAMSTCPHADTIPAGYISIGFIHTKRGVFLTGQGAKQTKELKPASLIIGYNRGEKYVEFNSTKKTVTFPDDTVVMFDNDTTATFYTLANSKNNTVANWSSLSTSAINVFLNRKTKLLECLRYDAVVDDRYILLCSIRTYNGAVAISVPYKWDGKLYNFISESEIDQMKNGVVGETNLVKAVNHRGYGTAPENTLSAFRLSAQKGFKYVEADISFTSDNVAVLLHDTTVDRTSNGTGSISSLTFDQVRAMDFGSWKSSTYVGEKIPTFSEFLSLCKNLGLHPYIELKYDPMPTEEQISWLVRTVKEFGMLKEVTWISFHSTLLSYVKNADSCARLGYVCSSLSDSIINTAKTLKNDTNSVFMDLSYSNVNADELYNQCISNDLPIEVWTLNDTSELSALLSRCPYVSGVTSDSMHAGRELYAAHI